MELEQIHFADKASFRQWLEAHHKSSAGIWMMFYKKHTGQQNISYEEAMEEAISFGWIDSIIKKLDADRYLRKFTPRKDFGNWSELNQKRATKLFRQGELKPSGLETLKPFFQNGKLIWPEKQAEPAKLSKDIMAALSKNQPALHNFEKLAPSYQKHFILWISDAKREATRKKRISEAVELLKKNQKLGMK